MRDVIAAVRRTGGASVSCRTPQAVLERLDMDIGGLGLHRPSDDLVDKADHRRLARQIFQALGVLLQWLVASLMAVSLGFLLSLGIQAVESRLELDRYRDQQVDHVAGCGADRLRREMVERVGNGELQVIVGHTDRQRTRLAQEA